MKKQTFLVKYSGSNRKLQGFLEQITAKCHRQAVEIIYARFFDADYFPEDNSILWGGVVKDCEGNIIANAGDDTIDYDGGSFYADQISFI